MCFQLMDATTDPVGSLAMQTELVEVRHFPRTPARQFSTLKVWLLIARRVLLRTALPPKRGKH